MMASEATFQFLRFQLYIHIYMFLSQHVCIRFKSMTCALYDAKVSKSSHVCHAWLELSTAQLHEALVRCMCHFRDVSFEVALSRRFGRKFRRAVQTSRRPVQLGLNPKPWGSSEAGDAGSSSQLVTKPPSLMLRIRGSCNCNYNQFYS